MRLDRDRCALVLVDYQARLMPAIAGHRRLVDEAIFLARVARTLGLPVVGTEQNPAGLGANVDAVRVLCETTLPKLHFDATADGLVETLRAYGRPIDQVVIAGCEAHVCLMQTALGLREAGLAVAVVPEACGSRRSADHAVAMQRLAQAGVVSVSAEMAAFEWLRRCDGPEFGRVLALVKQRPLVADD